MSKLLMKEKSMVFSDIKYIDFCIIERNIHAYYRTRPQPLAHCTACSSAIFFSRKEPNIWGKPSGFMSQSLKVNLLIYDDKMGFKGIKVQRMASSYCKNTSTPTNRSWILVSLLLTNRSKAFNYHLIRNGWMVKKNF